MSGRPRAETSRVSGDPRQVGGAVRSRWHGNLLAIVAHDLRTPLSAIQLSARVLLADAAATGVQRRNLERITASSARIAWILRTLCDFMQRAEGSIPLEPERVDAWTIVQQAVGELEDACPGRTILTRGDGDLRVVADAGRLFQVVSNLVANAVQHGSTDTAVTVAARGERAAVVIEVHNDGPPIPQDVLGTLFEPYSQGAASRRAARRTGSMGLGLFIAHEIVRAHRGELHVESTAAAGTTFTVVVPRAPSMSARPPAAP